MTLVVPASSSGWSLAVRFWFWLENQQAIARLDQESGLAPFLATSLFRQLGRKNGPDTVPLAPFFAFYIEGSVRRSAPHIEGRPGHMRTTTTDSRNVTAGGS